MRSSMGAVVVSPPAISRETSSPSLATKASEEYALVTSTSFKDLCARESGETPRKQQLGFTPRAVSPSKDTVSPPQVMVRLLIDGLESQDCIIPIAAFETIRELKLKLSKKSWFTSKHCLFFGEREVLDNQLVADIVQRASTSADNEYLHVFVKLQDVHAGKINTDQSTFSFGTAASTSSGDLTNSALTAALDAIPSADDIAPEQQLTGFTPRACAEVDPTVIHLVIRKSANFSWQSGRSGDFELVVSTSDTAQHVKRLLPAASPTGVQGLELVYNGVPLEADRPLAEYGLDNGAVLELVPWEPVGMPITTQRAVDFTYPDGSPMLSSPAHNLYLDWQRANMGLRAGAAPNLAPSGSGGSYFCRDPDGTVVAVFKPADEEPNMRNNPRGFNTGGSGLRRGVLPGEGALREHAAYLLDEGRRAGVPATSTVTLRMPDGTAKFGSLQKFVRSDCDCEEMGPSAFSVDEVHKIAVLDLRLANADRNGSNILARREADGRWSLTPIDHGYCLPDSFEDMSFEWSSWPQGTMQQCALSTPSPGQISTGFYSARVPFSPDTVDYIRQIDPDKDLALLLERGLGLRPECERIYKAAVLLLKKFALRGLSPADAADMAQRSKLQKSPLEKLHKQACVIAFREEEEEETGELAVVPLPAVKHPRSFVPKSDAKYLHHLSTLLDLYLDELATEPSA